MIKTKNLILAAIFAALTAIGAFIKIPLPYVPFTLQFLFCSFSGIILGSRLGALSQIAYVGIGLLGMPVFAEGGGIGYVLHPTFGYLIGFIAAAYVIGRITESIKKITVFKLFSAILAGLFFVYLSGVLYLFAVYNLYLGESKSFYWAFYYGFLICVGGDLVLSFLTAAAAAKIIPAIKKYI